MLASPERIQGWRSGKWPFDGWTVERAVREYNRYSGKPVYLDLGERGKTPILGQYLIGDPDAFVRAVAKAIDARVVDRGDSLLLVPKLE